MYLIRSLDLSFEIFLEIVNIYDQTVGGNGLDHCKKFDIVFRTMLANAGIIPTDQLYFTFGSALSKISQLRIIANNNAVFGPCLLFQFIPEIPPYDYDEAYYELAREIVAEFEFAVDNFLTENDLAVN